MPLLGGLAIYCGTVLAVIASLDGQPRGQILGILGAGTLLLVTGILDDRGLLHHQIKLFVSMPLAALTLVALGVRFHVASVLIPGSAGRAADIGPVSYTHLHYSTQENIHLSLGALASRRIEE